MSLKISGINVNGIRSACTKGLVTWLKETSPDIVCIQELKAQDHDIPNEIRDLGYEAFYHAAEKKGYSGVAILSNRSPLEVEVGIGTEWVDAEGRLLVLHFKDWSLCSIYAPSGTTGEVRQHMKYVFLDLFESYIKTQQEKGRRLIFVGDFNIAHQEVDIHNPKGNKNSSGFLPEERDWFTKFLQLGYVDVFRYLHPSITDVYSWWSFRANSRNNNKGWRIDYQIADASLISYLREAYIETEVILSDHAPVTAIYDL